MAYPGGKLHRHGYLQRKSTRIDHWFQRHRMRYREVALKHWRFIVLMLVTAFGGNQSALAHLKTDTVTLYNGDRVTGEIKQLYGGLLNLKTDSMGTVKVEWQEIAKVSSEYHYEIRTSDGRRFFGSIDSSVRAGQLQVRDMMGTHDLEWLEVVELRPVEDTLVDRLHVYLSAGYSYTKASGVRQVSFTTDVSYESEFSRSSLSGRSSNTDTNEETTSSNRYDLNRRLWKDRAKYFRTFGVGYEDNDEFGLKHRINVGGGLGRYFIDTHQTRLISSAGLQVITEKSVDTGEEQDIELFLSADYAAWRFNTPELDLNLGVDLYPSISDSGRVRSDLDLRLRWEIVEDLFLDVTAWTTTDNQAESDRETDYGITTGVGWEY